MSVSANSVPVGYGTVAGAVLTGLSIVGGVVLLLAGKTPAEKAAGKELLAQAVPITGGLTILGRMLQAKGAVKVVEDAIPAPLREIADVGLRLVATSPDGVDGPHVARATEASPDPELPAAPVAPPVPPAA